MDPLRHCPLCGPCMMLAGRLEAPSGSECATSSISSTEGPPRLVLLLDSKLGPCLPPVSFDVPSPLFQLSLFPSESETTTLSAAPCVELELSLRKRPMIDFGCFGFSMPPGCRKLMRMGVFCFIAEWIGKKRKKCVRKHSKTISYNLG